MRGTGDAGVGRRKVSAPPVRPMLRVRARSRQLVCLVEQRDAAVRAELVARQRAAELPVRDVRAGTEALDVASARMRVRDRAFPVVRVPLAERGRQAPRLVLALVLDVD